MDGVFLWRGVCMNVCIRMYVFKYMYIYVCIDEYIERLFMENIYLYDIRIKLFFFF